MPRVHRWLVAVSIAPPIASNHRSECNARGNGSRSRRFVRRFAVFSMHRYNLRDAEVASSNLVAPIHQNAVKHWFFRHFSLIATLAWWLGCDFTRVFFAFHPVIELQQDVADDRSSASPFVADFFQVAKHSIATLNVIVCADLAAN